MKCPKCKKQLRKNARFCPACGERIKRKQRMPKLLIIAILLVIVALGWGLGIWVAKHFGRNNRALFSGMDTVIIQNAEDAIEHFKEYGEEYGYENALSELTEQVTTTISGDSYYRLQQNYQGIPVYGRTVICTTDENGNVDFISGNAMDVSQNISIIPSVTLDVIEKSIAEYCNDVLGIKPTADYGFALLADNSLCIYASDAENSALAYCVSCGGYEFVVNAVTGEILNSRKTFFQDTVTCYNVDHSESFNGLQQDNGTYILKDVDKGIYIYDAQNSTYWNPDTGEIFNQNLTLVTSNNTTFGDEDDNVHDSQKAYSLLSAISDIYDYYSQTLNETGCGTVVGICNDAMARYNGGNAGGGFEIILEAIGSPIPDHDNLMHGGRVGAITVGYMLCQNIENCIDTIGHEYTHYITYYHVNWTNNNIETGAINEAYSDIFGELIEASIQGKTPNWVHGSRVIYDPSMYGYPKYLGEKEMTSDGWVAVHNSTGETEYTDYSHAYSTVISHAAYLMWNGIDGNTAKRINNDELAELWYRAMLMMPSNCNFVECRKFVERAADSMENLTNDQRLCISEAFDIVGIASRENAMTAEYHLTKNSSLNVFDEDGNLYAGYTLKIIGELIDNEPTVNIPGALRNTRYEKEYQIEDPESFCLNLPGGLYTLTVSDKYSSSVYSVTAYVSNEGTDNSIEIYTSYEKPLVVVVPNESIGETEPPFEEILPPEQNEQPKTLMRINRYDENGILKQETIFNYSANEILINAVDRELDQTSSVVHEAVIPFTFDEKGRLTEIGTADSDYYYYDTAGYVYNNGDQLISSFLASGGASGITYEYDNQNRLVRKFEDDYSAPITVETFFYYDDDTKSEIRAKEITTSSWEGERPTIEEKTYVYSFDGNGRVVTICGESDITTYRYEYWPIVIEEHVNSDTGYMYQELNYVDRMGETIWSIYLSSAISEEQTLDDGSLEKLNLSTNSGIVTYEFVYCDSESTETNRKSLKYPISEEDCYVIYKNYYGCEMESDEYQVQVYRHGSGTEEVLVFNIYRLNEISGGFTWTNAFSVYVNTGICSLEFSDEFFQADDYYY